MYPTYTKTSYHIGSSNRQFYPYYEMILSWRSIHSFVYHLISPFLLLVHVYKLISIRFIDRHFIQMVRFHHNLYQFKILQHLDVWLSHMTIMFFNIFLVTRSQILEWYLMVLWIITWNLEFRGWIKGPTFSNEGRHIRLCEGIHQMKVLNSW